eukprot:TRINITY_DN3334_c0_g1_i4.p1 TRINITY_DN3334_c0_g1~~TRINITY_DN3334_c0_g1_i4.p1  ORF type:complete len:456 (-),score=55.92 TRINITY_DN3334_c0_g1_i4:159-1526(-)
MNEYGRINVEGDIPTEFQDKVKCKLSAPWPGVDLVLATHQHFIEMKNNLISRTVKLPEEFDCVEKINILPSETDWFYVLFATEKLILVNGPSFKIFKAFDNVESAEIKDFIDVGKPLLFLELSTGESVLTDGLQNYDLKQAWPPDEANQAVNNTIAKRLKLTSDHVKTEEQKLLSLKRFVDESYRCLAHKYNHNPTIQESSFQGVINPLNDCYEKSKNNVIQISEKHVDVWQDRIVCILSFQSRIALDNLQLQSVCEEPSTVTTKSVIAVFREDGQSLYPEATDHLEPEETGFAILIVPTSLVTLATSETVHINMSVKASQGCSTVDSIELSTQTLASKLDKPQNPSTKFLVDILAVFSMGVQEVVKISSDLGNLAEFEKVLEECGLEKSVNRFGYHCWKKEHMLFGSAIIYKRKSPQELSARLYALNYSTLGLVVKLLQKSKLPCDTKISLFKS